MESFSSDEISNSFFISIFYSLSFFEYFDLVKLTKWYLLSIRKSKEKNMVNIVGIQIDPKDISTVFVVMGALVLMVSIISSNLYGAAISLILMLGVPIIIWRYRKRQERKQADELQNQNLWNIYSGGED